MRWISLHFGFFNAFSWLLTLDWLAMMLRLKGIFIFLTAVLLWHSVKTEYNELSDLFNNLNDEVLNMNQKTAQLAWDTKWVLKITISKLQFKICSSQLKLWSTQLKENCRGWRVWGLKTKVEFTKVHRVE